MGFRNTFQSKFIRSKLRLIKFVLYLILITFFSLFIKFNVKAQTQEVWENVGENSGSGGFNYDDKNSDKTGYTNPLEVTGDTFKAGGGENKKVKGKGRQQNKKVKDENVVARIDTSIGGKDGEVYEIKDPKLIKDNGDGDFSAKFKNGISMTKRANENGSVVRYKKIPVNDPVTPGSKEEKERPVPGTPDITMDVTVVENKNGKTTTKVRTDGKKEVTTTDIPGKFNTKITDLIINPDKDGKSKLVGEKIEEVKKNPKKNDIVGVNYNKDTGKFEIDKIDENGKKIKMYVKKGQKVVSGNDVSDETSDEENERLEYRFNTNSDIKYKLLYYQWLCKNLNDIKEFGDHEYHPIGDGPYGKGKYKMGEGEFSYSFRYYGEHVMKVTPRYHLTEVITVKYEVTDKKGNTHTETSYETRDLGEKWGKSKEHKFSVPIILNPKESFKLCVGPNCDCLGTANMLCDDENQPDIEIEPRSQLIR